MSSNNPNASFTYVQNVSTVDVQDLNADRISAANVVAGSVVVLPTCIGNPKTLGLNGVVGQVVVDIDPLLAQPDLYIYTSTGWNPI